MARLSLDSFLLVPMGKSDKECDMCRVMLANALQTEYPHQQEALETAINLIVDMRTDGVIEYLAYHCKWTPAQGRHGDRVLHAYAKDAKAYVLAMFSEEGLESAVKTNGQLAGAIDCFWAMYDNALEIVGNAVARSSNANLAIEKKSPPQDLA